MSFFNEMYLLGTKKLKRQLISGANGHGKVKVGNDQEMAQAQTGRSILKAFRRN